MLWNWQRPDWPRFRWDAERLAKAEEVFLRESGTLAGVARHLAPAAGEQMIVDAMTTDGVTTSGIEGEILDRASVQSSVRRALGLKTEKRRATAAERGIAEVMVDLYRRFAEPLTGEMLFRWHERLFEGREMAGAGAWRDGSDPMQVISGAVNRVKVHFEAPPSERVPGEMEAFLDWFRDSGPGGRRPLPVVTRAGVSHLYFESIHPFEDGNGRIGRAIAQKAIAETLGQPSLIELSATILARRKGYYEALEAANRKNEITAWLEWFAEILLEAQRRTIAQVDLLIAKTRLLDRLRGQLNARQEKALLRMFREGPEGFAGGLSAGNYATITGAPPATVTRDLADLVEKGALARAGERRYARYRLILDQPNGLGIFRV